MFRAAGDGLMAFEFITKEFLIGAGSSLASAVAGFMAFSRFWVSNKARNANDAQQIDMLDRQERGLDRLEKENSELRSQIKDRDEEIRNYFRELSVSNAKLQIIEQQLQNLKEQNELLSIQVGRLTETNKELASEVAHLRATMRT